MENLKKTYIVEIPTGRFTTGEAKILEESSSGEAKILKGSSKLKF